MNKINVKINLPGGIVSIGNLQNILQGAEEAGISSIRFGNRQQLYFDVRSDQLEDLEHHFFVSDTSYEINTNDFPNMVSSYVSEDILDSSGWLREGVYKDILESFSFTPKLKVNLVDSRQTFIPFFTGNINFISSEISNYWYLYVRFPKTNILYCWSSLIYSEDICNISKSLENAIFDNPHLFCDTDVADGQMLEAKVSARSGAIRQVAPSALQLPEFHMACYEGFHAYGNRSWLGIYRRNELFPVAFLQELCAMCIQNRIAQIYTTPWKSIIIKGIPMADIQQWNCLLEKHGVNTRHAANELNWQTEDLCETGLQLKLRLAEELNRADHSIGNICFAVKINPKSGLFGSVIIRLISSTDIAEAQRFEILHTADFNPNSKKFVSGKNDIATSEIVPVLMEITRNYREQATSNIHYTYEETENQHQEDTSCQTVFQCPYCLSIYDEEIGDSLAEVPPGTLFNDLSDTFSCPLCEADKSAFIEIERHKIYN